MAATENVHEGSSSSAKVASDQVGDDLHNLRQDIGNLAETVRKLAGDKVGTAVQDAQAKYGDLESAIRRSPTQSAMIAAAMGFVFGLLLTR